MIKHANNTYSQYAHLSKIQVKIGQKVKARSGSPCPATPDVAKINTRPVRNGEAKPTPRPVA